MQPKTVIWQFFIGLDPMGVLGKKRLAHTQLQTGIWRSFNGQERMDALGINGLVHGQPEEVI